MLTQEEIVRRVRNHYGGDVEQVILFGSQARGEADEGSDLDLIIIRRTKEHFIDRLAGVPALPAPSDIFVYTPEEFAAMKEHENPFILSALENAAVLYQRQET